MTLIFYITCYNVNYFVSQPVGLDFTSGSGFCQWVWIWRPHGPDSLLYHVIYYTQPWHKLTDLLMTPWQTHWLTHWQNPDWLNDSLDDWLTDDILPLRLLTTCNLNMVKIVWWQYLIVLFYLTGLAKLVVVNIITKSPAYIWECCKVKWYIHVSRRYNPVYV